MSNTDRYWDVVIEEAAKGVSPPDLRREILARIETPPAPAAARPRAAIRRVLEFAVAACALLAIGVLTGVLRFGGDSAPDDGEGAEVSDPLSVAAAPGTEYVVHDDHIELKQGWLLVTTGAPEIRCLGSVLSRVDGRVLLRAGSMPSHAEAEAVSAWLNENQLEKPMILDARRWIITTAAVLVLSGSAFFDGNLIEASDKEEVPPVEIVWHEVANLMDIELLPEDAHYVKLRGSNLTGAHVEHLAKHKQIRGLHFGSATRVQAEHISILKTLNQLEYVDLSTATWAETMDYSGLDEITSLRHVLLHFSSKGVSDEALAAQTATIARLCESGTQVFVYATNCEWAAVERLISTAKLHGIDFGNSAHFMEDPARVALLAAIPTLKKLRLATTDLGISYLVATNQLESLDLLTTIHGRDGKSLVLQIGKLTNLRELCISPRGVGDVEESLGGLKDLKRLELSTSVHRSGNVEGFKGLGLTNRLDTLVLRSSVHDLGAHCQVLAAVKARRVELQINHFARSKELELPEMAGIEEIVFEYTAHEDIPFPSKDDMVMFINACKDLRRVHFLGREYVGITVSSQLPKQMDDFIAELAESTKVELTSSFASR